MKTPCYILGVTSPFPGIPAVWQVELVSTGDRFYYISDDRDLAVLSTALATGQTANIPADQPLIPVSAMAMLAAGTRQGFARNVTPMQED